MNDELKEKALSLIYFMQKNCARESWVEFLEHIDLTTEDAKVIFSEIAKKLELDGSKFYFKV